MRLILVGKASLPQEACSYMNGWGARAGSHLVCSFWLAQALVGQPVGCFVGACEPRCWL